MGPKRIIEIRVNWKRIVCIFSGGCVESPEELAIYTADNMVSLYCERCGALIRETPLHDITNPEMLETIQQLLEGNDE